MDTSAIKGLRSIGLGAILTLILLAVTQICCCDTGDGGCRDCGQSGAFFADGTGIDEPHNCSCMDYPVMRLPLEEILMEQKAEKNLSKAEISEGMKAIPAGSYSILDYLTYVPADRDQTRSRGGCGNCWVWASTAALELDMAYRNKIFDRLSIQYFDSNFRDGEGPSWACCGGFLTWFTDFYNKNGKAVPWSNENAGFYDCYRTCDDGSSSVPASAIADDPSYQLTSIVPLIIPTHSDQDEEYTGSEEAIANIKGVLQSNKGVIFTYFLDDFDPFISFWKWESEDAVWTPDPGEWYETGKNPGGHAVLCVGYDDTNPDNRYWIMLNSWGAPFNRQNGLFRVSMDMDYSYVYEDGLDAFEWFTFDVVYPEGEAPETPAVPEGPEEGIAGSWYSYLTSAIDPDGARVKYTFDWGDETTSETGFVESGSKASACHAWSEAGIYQVKAMATNGQGQSSGWSDALDVTISDNGQPSPCRLIGPKRGLSGKAYSYFASSRDSDGDLLRYTFDWGDGTSTTTSAVASGLRARASHSWAIKGKYQVSAKAVDVRGASSEWSRASVDIV